jgi:hypothetical protein
MQVQPRDTDVEQAPAQCNSRHQAGCLLPRTRMRHRLMAISQIVPGVDQGGTQSTVAALVTPR